MANVIPLPTARGAATPLDLILRVGETNYAQLAHLHGAGRLPVQRAILDASKLKHQQGFAKSLSESGVELILDTKAAELAARSKFTGRVKGAPWGGGTLHLAEDFDDFRIAALVDAIARVAVEQKFDRVLSPSHYLKEGVLDPWFPIDIKACVLLRNALDRNGGSDIAIDYPVIIEQARLRDEAVRAVLLNRLGSLPFENLVLRISHFGSDGTATALRAMINTLDRFHNVGHPVVVDHVGGLVGRALLAFGAASAVAHGIGELERFDASTWHKVPKEEEDETGGRGGRQKRVSLLLLDKSLTIPEINSLAKAKGGHSLIACSNPNCCRTLADMISNPRRHAIAQEAIAMAALNRVPDLLRAEHFLKTEMADVDRFGRQLKALKPVASELKLKPGQTSDEAAERLSTRMSEWAARNERMRATLENLHQVRGQEAPRSIGAFLAERVKRFRAGKV